MRSLGEEITPVALVLIEPDESWRTAFLAMAAEFVADGDRRYQQALDDWPTYLGSLQAFATGNHLAPGKVRETSYWGVHGSILIGVIRVRHTLTPRLAEIGGHIAYEIRPSLRRQGYGTALLGLGLQRAAALGFTAVLITCDSSNRASQRVIERNQGQLVYEGMVFGYDQPIKRYWIQLGES